jgi:hypothetical protein
MKLFQRSKGLMENDAQSCTLVAEDSAVADKGLTLTLVYFAVTISTDENHFDLLTAALNDCHLSVALTLFPISPGCLRPEQLYKPSRFFVLICLAIRSLNLPNISRKSRNHDSRQSERKGS